MGKLGFETVLYCQLGVPYKGYLYYEVYPSYYTNKIELVFITLDQWRTGKKNRPGKIIILEALSILTALYIPNIFIFFVNTIFAFKFLNIIIN